MNFRCVSGGETGRNWFSKTGTVTGEYDLEMNFAAVDFGVSGSGVSSTTVGTGRRLDDVH